MSDIQNHIQTLRDALEKATTGHWNKEGTEVWRRGTGYHMGEDAHVWICDCYREGDANLIANTPTWLQKSIDIISQQAEEIERLTESRSEHIDIIHHAYRVLSVMPDSIVVRMWLKRYENELIKGESPC